MEADVSRVPREEAAASTNPEPQGVPAAAIAIELLSGAQASGLGPDAVAQAALLTVPEAEAEAVLAEGEAEAEVVLAEAEVVLTGGLLACRARARTTRREL